MLALALLLIAGSFVADRYARRLRLARVEPVVTDTLPRGMCANYIISPYDSIIKIYSDSAGLDWRLVAAVIYHESKFDNDVRSHRGAAGLMQMMPATAEWLGADDITDPIEGVRVGTLYLKRLHNAYRGHTDDPLERTKFALRRLHPGAGYYQVRQIQRRRNHRLRRQRPLQIRAIQAPHRPLKTKSPRRSAREKLE